MQGQVAIYMDGVNFASQFRGRREVEGGWQGGLRGAASRTGRPLLADLHHRHGRLLQSGNKEAAYLFAQWATNKTNMVRELMAGVGVGRTSTWDSPDVKAKRGWRRR